MNQSLRQTTKSFHLLHSSYMWIQTVFPCGKHCQTMQVGTVSRLWSDFAGDLEHSKYTSGETLCIFGSHTFVPTSWMCKKLAAVSHSSTESEIISLDAGLRLDGIPALAFWDLIVSVFGNTTQNTIHKRKQSPRVINEVGNVDFVPSNVQSSHQEALLYVFGDKRSSDQFDH